MNPVVFAELFVYTTAVFGDNKGGIAGVNSVVLGT